MLHDLPIRPQADPDGGDQGSDTGGGNKSTKSLGLDKDKDNKKDKPKKP
jgi:hypothetical protein